ncbi:hypothetical protein [Streptomyces sp. NPDC056160]|uniref:hypothetical protein n=1 Tax=Streptomyces sp. NPDC056160 TaxID=3345731 RepID=UPI0035E2AC34
MKIRMTADISGSRNGRPWPRRGSTVDLPDGEGADLCAAGLAVPVAVKDADVEKATPAADTEQRQAEDKAEEKTPVTTEQAPAVAKKTPARKTAAKKTAASPAKD